ncbi:MAG: ATP-binding protein [Bacteroidota bacterium]|nr:ATP-binding protein [Bacteroidota bacterium]
MLKIIVTGPESSGKTTLCKALSKYFKIPFSKEYAREYLNPLIRDYTKEDLIKIAKGQLKSEQNSSLLDTDLITIKIWSYYKYDSCDNWILEQIEKQKIENRYYLLCKPDIAWKADPLRENTTNRKQLFEIYKEELKKLNHNYCIVEKENRTMNAISKILAQKPFF